MTCTGIKIFENCRSLADENGYFILDNVCYGTLSPLESIQIPSNVVRIADHAFDGNHELRIVSMSDQIKEIGNYAFANCEHLIQTTLSASITELSANCFDGCDALTYITIPNIPPEQLPVFLQIPAILGYCMNAQEYKDTSSDYENYIQKDPQPILFAAIDHHLPDALSFFTISEKIPNTIFSSVLEKAQQSNAMECVALLLEYRRKYLSNIDLFTQFDL